MDATGTAYIAAGAALAGASIGVGGAFGIEAWRARVARRKEAAERLLDALAETISAFNEWSDNSGTALTTSDQTAAAKFLVDADAASTRGNASKVRLTLIAPPAVLDWVEGVYEPAVRKLYDLTREAVSNRTPESIEAVADAFAESQAVIVDATEMLRREVAHLRSGETRS